MTETKIRLNREHIYQNVMELLVQEEIEKQLKNFPKNLINSLNKIEIEAYALNRLPALYASSEQGREKQKEIGQQKYQKEIFLAVHRALAAVEQNPYRESRSLGSLSEVETKYQEAEKALQKLQNLLIQTELLDNSSQKITWDNLVTVVRKALNKLYWRQEKPKLEISSYLKYSEISTGWDSRFIQ